MRYGKRRKGQKRKAGKTTASTASTAPAPSAGAAEPAEASQGSAGGSSLTPWWEKTEPSRLEDELSRLRAAGIEYEIDERAREKGLIKLNLRRVRVDGRGLDLAARFPDVYPYTRFEIRAPDLELDYHQNPFTGQLCLLGRSTLNWDTTNTLAGFIEDQVPRVLRAAESDDPGEVEEIEEHQGEPFSEYYSNWKDSMVIVDGAWSIDPSVGGGTLSIGIAECGEKGFRGAVLAVMNERGSVLASADPALGGRYPRHLTARWVRRSEPVRAEKPDEFLTELCARDERLARPQWRVSTGGARVDIVGVLFPEEHHWREEERSDGWVFVVRSQPLLGIRNRSRAGFDAYLARAGRAGRADLAARIPELSVLNSRKIAVIGTGGIGAPSAIELARCGVGELRLVDGDHVDPGTIVRWPLGITVAGKSKVESLRDFISANYPYTDVSAHRHRIGVPRESPEDPSDLDVLGRVVDGADLIYDATAEVGLNHLFSDLAAERGIPYVCVSTTFGAWGGRIIRIRPNGQTRGCWMCHQHWLMEGRIPAPPEDPNGGVQPAGCGDPTFTGAGFDVATIALGGVRLAASTLSNGAKGAYPAIEWDVAVISLRDEHGHLLAPRWETFTLERHPACENEAAHIVR